MKISFLASHGGSAARHLINKARTGELGVEIGAVITNNRDSVIYQWCHDNAVAVRHISGVTHPDEEQKDRAIHDALVDASTDIIVLSGYMKKIGPLTLSRYANRILNIHPSLLPKHGGKGFYGDRVHESVLRSGDRESGATVHYINEEYDEGPVIAQMKVSLSPDETLNSLKTKVQAMEGELYLQSIKTLLEKQL